MEVANANFFPTLRALLKKHGIMGFVIPSNDEFQNEYVPDFLNRLKFFSAFSGSNGVAIITLKSAAFFTDGRYLNQAAKELNKGYTILDISAKKSCDWFDLGLGKGDKLGYDPMLHFEANLNYYRGLAHKYGFSMVACERNLVDEIWKNRPKEKIETALNFEKFAGETRESKIVKITSLMDKSADYLLITNPDSICWLLNIRGFDIPYTPFLLSYLLLDKGGNATLYCNPKKVNFKLKNCKIKNLEDIKADYLTLVKKHKVQLDPNIAAVFFSEHKYSGNIIKQKDPTLLLKACKNKTEVKGFRECHIQDGAAVSEFLYWLFNSKQQIDEIKAAEKLLELRNDKHYFVMPSFATISAYGSNAAIIHYHPSTKTNKKIGKDNFYLLDSGGQYMNGTTDITRTMILGKPTKAQKRFFTLVLKGHTQLAMAKFPIGTNGGQLDALARSALWQEGLDYAHGTGHGVGHFLSVHEGPQRIGKGSTCSQPLEVGMVVSNEPGFYENGKFGIRIESLVLVVNSKKAGYLEFETLTQCPIQGNLIEKSLLTNEELSWIKKYNESCISTLSKHLDKKVTSWLKKFGTI